MAKCNLGPQVSITSEPSPGCAARYLLHNPYRVRDLRYNNTMRHDDDSPSQASRLPNFLLDFFTRFIDRESGDKTWSDTGKKALHRHNLLV